MVGAGLDTLKNITLLVVGLASGLAIAQLAHHFTSNRSQPGIAIEQLESRGAADHSAELRAAEHELQAFQVQGAGGSLAPGTLALAMERKEKEFDAYLDKIREDKAIVDTTRLLAAGFTQSRIDWIRRRAEELRSQRLQADFERQQKGLPVADPYMVSAYAFDKDLDLQNELGSGEYERYRKALGRSTTVAVAGVNAGSNAAKGGVMEGDEIVSYDDERVFSIDQVRSLALKGRPGSTVTVDILRRGQPMRLVVPTGPLGIEIPSWSARLQGN